MQHVHVENITNQQVGARIANVRGEMKMTQAELASEMSARLGRDIRPLTVTRLEGGKRPIGVDELMACAAALRIRAADLLSDDDLPVGAIRVASAGQDLFQTINTVSDAVRDWTWARDRLQELCADPKALESLPGGTRPWIQMLSAITLETIIADAQREARSV